MRGSTASAGGSACRRPTRCKPPSRGAQRILELEAPAGSLQHHPRHARDAGSERALVWVRAAKKIIDRVPARGVELDRPRMRHQARAVMFFAELVIKARLVIVDVPAMDEVIQIADGPAVYLEAGQL